MLSFSRKVQCCLIRQVFEPVISHKFECIYWNPETVYSSYHHWFRLSLGRRRKDPVTPATLKVFPLVLSHQVNAGIYSEQRATAGIKEMDEDLICIRLIIKQNYFIIVYYHNRTDILIKSIVFIYREIKWHF